MLCLLRRYLPAGIALLLLLPASVLAAPAAWQPANNFLPTRWDKDVSPANALPEYPRPQMTRSAWQSLNGLWEYGLTDSGADAAPAAYDGRILVPYPYESALSGVHKPSPVTQRLWYRRTFTVPASWRAGGQRVLLHFGAVNWDSTVSVNGQLMGDHKGGYTAFDYDVTSALRPGLNTLIVSAFNPMTDGTPNAQVVGKQRAHPVSVLYTGATGIWQSVWLEPVPEAHITSLKLTPDVDAKALHVVVNADGGPSRAIITALDGTKTVATANGVPGEEISLALPAPHLWSPSDPHLYTLQVALTKNRKRVDSVGSYFAMRKVSLGHDAQGRTKIFLNNKDVFEVGTLDQGYWPDGIYTAPTDAALRSDIDAVKGFGFNLIRKHAKVEPERWYYWADKLGVVVWQDMPQAFGDGETFTPETKAQWLTEWTRELAQFTNHPSIIVWTPFNEGWGQHDTAAIAALTKRLDPTRLVDAASGGYNQVVDGKMSQFRLPTPAGIGDINDTHTYPDPTTEKSDPTRALVCGEFGGISYRVPGHLWEAGNFGYGDVMRDGWHLTQRYQDVLKEAYGLRELGASAVVYTQIADVERETNGLLTYDRAVVKPLPQYVVAANHGRFPALPPAPVSTQLVPTSEDAPQVWSYTTQKPADNWTQPGFEASSWKTGPAPFGQGVGHPNTPWTDTPGDIWLRRIVTLPAVIPAKLVVRTIHDEDVEVYVNGVLAVSAPGYVGDYVELPLSDAAYATLKPGASTVIAVHCHQTTGGQVIDVGIVAALTAAAFAPKAVFVPWKAGGSHVAWKSSTAGSLWHDNPPLEASAAVSSAALNVMVDPTAVYQAIDGWGGCFNERGWAALSVLAPADKEKVLRSLFDPSTGLKLNICRTPIGASDYAVTPYSLDDMPSNTPDYQMAHFSIARDKEKLIPFIKAALALRPDLKVWGVPWSPPTWMKTNGLINTDNNGFMKTDPQTLAAYALYFEKYIQAYQAQGIPLFMVAPQNEPTQATGYPGCFWTGEALRDFLTLYLGPKLAAAHVRCQTWLGTPTNDRTDIVAPTLNAPNSARYVQGYGLQYDAVKVIPAVLRAQPNAKIMETETPCGNHENDWSYAEGQFKTMMSYLSAGANSYMLWNMVLDQNGSNWSPQGYDAGWRQCSPVVVNRDTKAVTYTPQFIVFKHFSYFVRPGARRVDTSGSYADKIAFRNPNGDVVLVMQNSADTALMPTIDIGGRAITPTLPPHSWNTFTLAAGSADAGV